MNAHNLPKWFLSISSCLALTFSVGCAASDGSGDPVDGMFESTDAIKGKIVSNISEKERCYVDSADIFAGLPKGYAYRFGTVEGKTKGGQLVPGTDYVREGDPKKTYCYGGFLATKPPVARGGGRKCSQKIVGEDSIPGSTTEVSLTIRVENGANSCLYLMNASK